MRKREVNGVKRREKLSEFKPINILVYLNISILNVSLTWNYICACAL